MIVGRGFWRCAWNKRWGRIFQEGEFQLAYVVYYKSGPGFDGGQGNEVSWIGGKSMEISQNQIIFYWKAGYKVAGFATQKYVAESGIVKNFP